MFVKTGIAIAAGLAAILATAQPGAAEQANVSCVGSAGMVNCSAQWGPERGGFPQIIQVPGPKSEQEMAAAKARDREWETHCRPVLVENRYGVGEYRYAVRGCEFGKTHK